jgi:manganese transport protein
VIVGLGVNATDALVVSQVILSLTLPLPMIALLAFTQRADIMGAFANGPVTRAAATAGAALVLLLNAVLLLQTFGVRLPFLAG